ncbi:MAG: hypothetical protein GYA87_01710 [Christensenellaceae bacterium]|nr:hypothetical protein [Christensenellaceae bacterium]
MLFHTDFKNNTLLKYNPKIICFEKDNFEFENDDIKALSEGYYLEQTPQEQHFNLSYKAFTDIFKGAYIFVCQNKKRNNVKIYNDLLSKAYIFYYNNEDFFACSSNYFELINLLRQKNIKLDYDCDALNYFIKAGVFKGHSTYFEQVKFLKAFEYIEIDNTAQIKNIPYPEPISDISFNEAVDKAYALFEQGSNAIINKNKKYNKSHVCSLSGGMDSRAIFLQLIKNDIKPIYTFCYAQKGSKDESISNAIAKDFGSQHIFYDISGGEFIKNRNSIIEQNQGQMVFSGSTGAYDAIRQVKANNIGLVYLGIGGGEIMGDIITEAGETPIGNVPKANYIKNLDDIRVCMNSALAIGGVAQSASPFLYEDLFLFLMRLPAIYKLRRRLYVAMFKKYMPNKYCTTMFRGKIGNVFAKPLRIMSYIFYIIFKKNKYNMNPFELWWQNNDGFKDYINNSFYDDIKALQGFDTSRLNREFDAADVYKKTNIISLSFMLKILKSSNGVY